MVDDAKREITGLSLGQELLLYLYKMCTKRQLSSKSNKKKFVVIGILFAARRKEAKSPAGTNGDSGNFIC